MPGILFLNTLMRFLTEVVSVTVYTSSLQMEPICLPRLHSADTILDVLPNFVS